MYREGSGTVHPYKRARLTAQDDSQPPPQAKRTRTEDSQTGPTHNTKYSDSVHSSLLDKLRAKFHVDSIKLISAAYSHTTWKTYEAAYNSFVSFEVYNKNVVEWPLTQNTLNSYISWATLQKNLKHSTISTYVASLSSVHQLFGFEGDIFSSFITKAMLRGSNNLATSIHTPSHTRKVFTLSLLKLVGHAISQQDWEAESKLVFWSCLCVAFFGSFRIGELLAAKEEGFDYVTTLLWKNVKIRGDNCLIHIESPKSNSKEGDFVDLFTIPGKDCCPVTSLKNLKNVSNVTSDSPVFCFKNSKPLTPPVFNQTLRSLLEPFIGISSLQYSSHSLRAAIPSALAKTPYLANDQDIKGWGRWDSPCYRRYTRLELDRKRHIYGKIRSAIFS